MLTHIKLGVSYSFTEKTASSELVRCRREERGERTVINENQETNNQVTPLLPPIWINRIHLSFVQRLAGWLVRNIFLLCSSCFSSRSQLKWEENRRVFLVRII